jgi:predicted short-subunit dehydrogenase-like oxidoreductase (DUF2520 family)
MQQLKISIVGSGNVATHLAQNLHQKGHSLIQVYSRNFLNAQTLATKVNASAINEISKLNNHVDLILLCVSDSAMPEIIKKIKFQPKLIAHTAGSISLNELTKFDNCGVFYPLQTFSKNSKLNIKTVPFCIEANTQENKNILLNLASSMSDVVYEMNTELRMQCHLAAIFANNFANHMFHVSEQLLNKFQIPFDILKPIILETANKVQHISPSLAQTGPASRNDQVILEKHLTLLKSPHLEKIYSFVSESIWEVNNKQHINTNTNDE